MTKACTLWAPHRHPSLTVGQLAQMLEMCPASAKVQVWWKDTNSTTNVLSPIVDVARGYDGSSGTIVALLIGGEGGVAERKRPTT